MAVSVPTLRGAACRLCLRALFEPSLLFAELSAAWRNAMRGWFFSLVARAACR